MIIIINSRDFPEELRDRLSEYDPKSEVFVYFPDKNELFSASLTLEEAIELSKKTGGVIAL